MEKVENQSKEEIKVVEKENIIKKEKGYNPFKRYMSAIVSMVFMLLVISGIGYYTSQENKKVQVNTSHIDLAGYTSDHFYKLVLTSHYLARNVNGNNNEINKEEVLNKMMLSAEAISTNLNNFKNGGYIDIDGDMVKLDPLSKEESVKALSDIEEIWPTYFSLIKEVQNSNFDSQKINALADFSRQNQENIYDTLDIIVSTSTLENIRLNDIINKVSIGSVIFFLVYVLVFITYFVRKFAKTDIKLNETYEKLEQSFDEVQEARNKSEETVKELNKSNQELERLNLNLETAKKEVEISYLHVDKTRKKIKNILDTTNIGLMILNKDLKLETEYSKVTEKLFGKKDIGNQSIIDILSDMIANKDLLNTTIDYVHSLYKKQVVPHLIKTLNPLSKVEVYVNHDVKNEKVKKYLDFEFTRVYDDNEEISGILVTVNDVTDIILLQSQIEEEKEQNLMQLEMFDKISNTDKKVMSDFVKNINIKTSFINNILREEQYDNKLLKEKVVNIGQQIHSVKGEASVLGFKAIVNIAEKIEDTLANLKTKNILSGNDFIPVTKLLDDMWKIVRTITNFSKAYEIINDNTMDNIKDEANSVIEEYNKTQISNLQQEQSAPKEDGIFVETENVLSNNDWDFDWFGSNDETNNTEENLNESIKNEKVAVLKEILQNFVNEVGFRNGKQIKLNTENFNSDLANSLSDEQFSIVKDMAIQFIRNSAVHGIEKPYDRKIKNKKEFGTIQLSLVENNGKIEFSFQDDGKGLDVNLIKQKALEMNLISSNNMPQTNEEIYKLIFEDGFSTAKSNTEDAGRGVGMGIIKNYIFDLRNKTGYGKLNINSNHNQGVKFTVMFNK